MAKVPEHDLVEEVLHSIGTDNLFSNPGEIDVLMFTHTAKLLALPSARTEEAEKSPTDPEPLALEADWLVDNLALFILQILPPFIFRGSVRFILQPEASPVRDHSFWMLNLIRVETRRLYSKCGVG